MNRRDLVQAVSTQTGVERKDVDSVLKGFTDVVTAVVSKGEAVSISGFAKFVKVDRPARMGRNPQTQQPVRIKASKKARITPLKGFKDAVVKTSLAPKLERGVWPPAPPAKKAAAKKTTATKTAAKKAPAEDGRQEDGGQEDDRHEDDRQEDDGQEGADPQDGRQGPDQARRRRKSPRPRRPPARKTVARKTDRGADADRRRPPAPACGRRDPRAPTDRPDGAVGPTAG